MKRVEIFLPYSVLMSVNERTVPVPAMRGRTKLGYVRQVKSRRYRSRLEAATAIVQSQTRGVASRPIFVKGVPVEVSYSFRFPQDGRDRDVSNFIKLPEDALVDGGVMHDDNQVRSFHAFKQKPVPPSQGGVFIIITPFVEEVE